MPDASLFCNRCGARMTQAEKVRHPGSIIPPPRPARRYPMSDPYAKQQADDNDQEIDEEGEEGFEEPEEEQVPKKKPGKKRSEEVIFRINQAFWPGAVAYFLATVCTLAISAIVYYISAPFWIALGFAAVCFIPAVIRHIRLMNTIYLLTNTKIEIETGVFSKSSRNIPLRHVMDVFVSETFKERLIGIGDILIETAAREGRIKLDNISDPRRYADMILDQLQQQ
ncbi:MAG: PH domain-containing protein [Blastocatellia bacterium]|nr:PH domain-containing protein [Blastocatellia bacterium]